MADSFDPKTANARQQVIAGVDLGDGTNALLVLVGTRTGPTTVAGSTSSTPVFAADPTRRNGVVVNNDTSKTLWLAFNGAAAVVGSGQAVAPNGGSYSLTPAQVAGATNGIWPGGVTGNATTTSISA